MSLTAKTIEKLGKKELHIVEPIKTDTDRRTVDSLDRDASNIFQDYYEDMLSLAKSKTAQQDSSPKTVPPALTSGVKLIAFYLPQYHPIPENDAWWGKGFTEWTNVSKAVPEFLGHYQPRLPGELGFYDLRLIEVQKRQIELARQHGIYGFCFHYYWFDGKRMLEQPLNQFLTHPELDFPFCLCWANENWTRGWDGSENQVLIAQTYTKDWESRFIADIEAALRDRRYVRIDDRPVLVVYAPSKIPSAKAALHRWRTLSRERGIGDLYILGAQTFGFNDPRSLGFDGMVEFPPHNTKVVYIRDQVATLNPSFDGRVCDYRELVREKIAEHQASLNDGVSGDHFLCVMPGWDNEARRPGRGMTFAFSTPALYARFLRSACEHSIAHAALNKRLVFINAWNEWSEGAYLEPDYRYGYAYLQATSEVLQAISRAEPLNGVEGTLPAFSSQTLRKRHDTAVILHLHEPNAARQAFKYLQNLRGNFDLFISTALNINLTETEIRKRCKSAHIYQCENQQDDITAFLQIFPEIYASDYKYVCKIPTNKSLPGARAGKPRPTAYSKLLGSSRNVSTIKDALDRADVGMVAAAGDVLTFQHDRVGNEGYRAVLNELCEKIRLDVRDIDFKFVAGAMFWFKPRALELLQANVQAYNDSATQREKVEHLTQVLNRFIGLVCEQEGYSIVEVDDQQRIRTPRFGSDGKRDTQQEVLTT